MTARGISLLMAALTFASPTFAADCGRQNGDILQLRKWTAEAAQYGASVWMNIENRSDKGMRMVKATAHFYDPFGEKIAALSIGPDIKVKPRSLFIEAGTYYAERLSKVDPADVTAFICVEGLVYADGTKEEFK